MAKKDLKKEIEFFEKRKPSRTYVSKAFSHLYYRTVLTTEKRFVKKVFKKESFSEFVEVEGELILRESELFGKKYQISAIVYSIKDTNLLEFSLQKFIEDEKKGISTVKDVSFSFKQDEFTSLLKFLSDLKFLDYSNKERFVVEENSLPNRKILINLTAPDKNKVLVDKDLAELVEKLSDLDSDSRKAMLETLRNNVLTKSDLNILSGRKEGLELFEKNLELGKLDEPSWQEFFKNNSWIFGYGLDYQFLSILQKEAHLSAQDLDGKESVKADFLLGTNNFTVIVELKKPETPLFENTKNRSKSWKLSKDLTYSVSQILAQKAEWEINLNTEHFDEQGNPIKHETLDPKTILIIGSSSQYQGNNRDDLIKRRTFELYRRNSRNIEIVTYDELYERAKFIVNDGTSPDELPEKIADHLDLPF